MKIRPRNRRIGILLSGRGSNFEAIAANVAAGKLSAEIAVVISNVESAAGLAQARALGLNALCIPISDNVLFSEQPLSTLNDGNVSSTCSG